MATWKDGAAYAPVERPDGFATPVAEPLSVAPDAVAATPGPVAPPQRLDVADQPPLELLGQAATRQRNPSRPFDVAAATMMSVATLADGRRDPRAPFAVAAPAANSSRLPPPPSGMQPLAFDPPGAAPAAPSGAGDDAGTRRTLGIVFAVVCAVGILVPATTPIVLTITGVIAFLRLPKYKTVNVAVLGCGALLLFLQLLGPGLALEPLLRLAGLLAAVAFLVIAFGKADDTGPTNAPPPGYGGPPSAPPFDGPGAPPPARPQH